MAIDSENEDADSEANNPDSFDGENGDVDVYLNHYRISKSSDYANNSRDGCKRITIGNGIDYNNGITDGRGQINFGNGGKILSLTELAAQKVASHLPFGQVEHFDPPVPEPMQCRIAFWSFPQDEEAIRLYTCLANGNADVFIRAEDLISLNCVCDMLQVGFHLSANVKFIQDSTDCLDCFRVAITFDRRRITSCSCSCSASTFWCMHAVAVCLHRIRNPQEVILRAPVSESLQRLEKNQLQKFAQYLINELPQQILPAAQKLLDELLSGDEAHINKNPAAPDPTAGATINEQTSWCLDDSHLSLDIRKILLKQCATQPIICSDPQSLDETPPPAAADYSQLLRPIRGREPEGLWNLISIVNEMMKRRDTNFFLLLEIITEEVLQCEQVVIWWFETKVSLYSGSTFYCSSSQRRKEERDRECTSQHTCSNFCDEIVHLWRLAALNPSSTPAERQRLFKKFFDWHLGILKRLTDGSYLDGITIANRKNYFELFPGFKPSMEGCMINWNDWDDKKGRILGLIDINELKETKSAQKRKKKKMKARKALSVAAASTTSETTHLDEVDDENDDKSNINEEESKLDENKPSTSGSHQHVEKIQQPRPLQSDASSQRQPLQELDGNQDQEHAEEDRVEPDLQIYFMDRQLDSPSKDERADALEDTIKVNPRKLSDGLEILYAKTEGLYAHGHLEQSLRLAFKITNSILSDPNYPSNKQLYNVHRRRRKKGTLDNQMSIVASEVLSKIAFLCNVLMAKQDYHSLVFKLVLFGVKMKRLPAATKPLEVKLINQKQDLILMLKSLVLHDDELKLLREEAQAICDGLSDVKSDAVTVLIMGNYLFEALVLSKSNPSSTCNQRNKIEVAKNGSSSSYNQSMQFQVDEHFHAPNDLNQQSTSHGCNEHTRQPCALSVYGKLPTDTTLGFHAALQAISVAVNVVEIDHPLLCEGIRRQRGELVVSLLTHYKDDQEKLDLILKHLLDNDVVLSSTVTSELPKVASTSSLSKLGRKACSSKSINPTSSATGSSNDISDPSSKVNPIQACIQPTEASAHFMFELAKTVFEKAGGNSMTTHLFRPQLVNQNSGRGIHRRLHMCTLRIALYALGLQNRTCANWMDRNYSGRASFIHDQALDIGLPAIKFLSENWEGHLSPVEVVSIADKASCLDDAETKKVAAEMAKSCLKFANNLDFHAVRRIFGHCEKQSSEMVEDACGEIERVADHGNVCSDVLFATSKAWYSLYEKLVFEETQQSNCYLPKEDVSATSELETGASEWIVTSAQSTIQEKQYNQFCEPSHWMHRDDYIRPEYIPMLYLPTHKHIEYVKSSFRVGIKALDALKLTPLMGSKHNPKKEDDVIWLLNFCKSLDISLEWSKSRECLHKFSQSVIKSIANPQILHIISKELIEFFKAFPQDHADRVNILLPIIDKSLEKFVKQTRDLMKHISYDQKNVIETIMDQAQELTFAANTLSASGHFKELLIIVDSKKADENRKISDNKRTRKYRGIHIDTYNRHKWVNDLLSHLKHCCCIYCRIGREISVNFMTTCSQCT